MMEPQNTDLSVVSRTSVGLMHNEEGRETFQRRPVGLTITVEKIDLALADVQAKIELLRRDKINLGLVRVQLAAMETKWRAE